MVCLSITVNNSFTTNANDITTNANYGIVNIGTITFTGGTNTNIISGNDGRLEIEGIVTNDADVTQKEIEVTGSLTNDTNGIIKSTDITNCGNITNVGTITSINAIKNSNTGTITSNADNIKAGISNAGTYNITGGTVSYKITGTGGTININESEVTISTSVSGNRVNLATTMKMKEDSYLADSTLVIQNGAILITQNNQTSDISGMNV